MYGLEQVLPDHMFCNYEANQIMLFLNFSAYSLDLITLCVCMCDSTYKEKEKRDLCI